MIQSTSNRSFPLTLIIGCLAMGSHLPAIGEPVSFRSQVAPILLEQCQSCHGPTEQKGGYRLDTFDFLSRNEDAADPVLAPGKPEKSKLFTLLVSDDRDDRMPKKADALPKAQADLIKRWIAEGAKFDGPDTLAALVEILPPRTHPKAPETYPLPLPVTALAFSPDGSELFAGGLRELTVWNPADGSLKRRIGNLPPRTFAIAFSPAASVMAVAGGAPGEYGELRLLDPKSGAFKQQLQTSSDALLDVKFSPGGALIATAGADHTLSVFDAPTGQRKHRLTPHSDAVTAVAFSPDGTQLASVGLDRGAKVFDTVTGKLNGIYRDHQAPLYSVAFTPDGTQILSGGRDKALHQWAVVDGKKQKELLGQGDVMKILVCDGHVYTVGSSGKLNKASLADLKPGQALEGAGDWLYSLALHPESKRVAVGGYDGTVTIWNLADGKIQTTFMASPGCKPPSVTQH